MQRCPDPACPFRVRHGFAAQFEDHVERCRSCGGGLEPAPEEAGQEGAGFGGVGARRLAATAVLVAGLGAFTRVAAPGFELAAPLELGAASLGLGQQSLEPALIWLVLAAILVELAALAWPGWRPQRRSEDGRQRLRAAAIVLALVGLLVDGWQTHASLMELSSPMLGAPAPQLGLVVATRCVGLPMILILAAINERWGLGHGLSIVVAGLAGARIFDALALADDRVQTLTIVLVTIGAAFVWLTQPARGQALGRTSVPSNTGAGEGGLGLGVTIPITGVVALELLVRAPLVVDYELVERLGRQNYELILLTLAVVLSAGFAWLFCRPALLLARWRRAFPKARAEALAAEARAVFRRGLLRSELLVCGVWLLSRAQFPAFEALVLAAILADLGSELRLRMGEGELVALPTQLDVPGAAALALALELRRKPARIQALHHRALYHLFGWWLPTRVLVRPEDLDAAEQLREAMLAD